MISRVTIAAEMQGRDLLKRRVALTLLVALPASFYLSMAFGSSEDPFIYTGGGISMGWSVAGAALFCMLASRECDPRLVLAGYRPLELLLGRFLLILALALLILIGFTALVAVISDPPHLSSFVIGLALAGLVGVPFGLAAATLLRRELEGILVIICVVGINMSIVGAAAPFFPFYGATQFFSETAGVVDAGSGAVLHAICWALALFAVAILAWLPQVRIGRQTH